MLSLNVGLNLEAVPTTVANATGVTSVEVAGILCSFILVVLMTLPFVYARIRFMVVPMGMFAIFTAVGLGWLAGWVTMLVVLAVAGLFSFGFVKNVWS